MRQKITALSLLCLVVLNTGCASYWKLTEATTRRTGNYQLSVPADWMLIEQGSSILLSKHGPSLEHIIILRHNIALPLPLTSLVLYTGMQPHELGELILYRLIAAPGVSNVVLEEETVETISDRTAVRVTVEYKLNETTRRDIVYAFIDDVYLYELRYSALSRYYFEENLNAFEGVVTSFRLKGR